MPAADRVRSSPLRTRLLIALGVGVALVAVAWGALVAAFPPARVRALVGAQLQRAFRQPVRFADVGVALWPPVRLHADQVALAEPGGFAAGTALAARRVDLDLDAWALLRRGLVVRRLVLEEPSVHVVLRPDGRTNLDSLMAPAPRRRDMPMDLDVRSFVVKGGRALIDDLRAQRRTSARVDATLAFESRAGGRQLATHGRTEITELALAPMTARRLQEFNRALAPLHWVLAHDGRFDAAAGRLTLDRMEVRFGRTALAVSGTVDHPGPTATVHLRARGDGLDVGELLRFLSVAELRALHGVEGAGRARFDLAVDGRLGPGRLPQLTGTAALADARLRYPGAPAAIEGVSFHARFVPDQMSIGDLQARIEDQPLRAQLELRRFTDPELRFALQGDIDLGAVAPLVAPRDVKLGGRAGVNVSGAGRVRDPGGMALQGRAQLTGGSLASPRLPKPWQEMTGVVEFSSARALVRGLTARAGSSRVRLDADVTRPLALLAAPGGRVPPAALQFTFTSPHFDVAELVPPGPADPIRVNAIGGGHVAIAELRNQKLALSNLQLDAAIEPSSIALPRFTVQAYGGTVRGSARLVFGPRGLGWAVQGRADTLDTDRFVSAWTPARGVVHGLATSTFDLAGEGVTPEDARRSLSAAGLALLANGRVGGPTLAAIAAATRIPAFKDLGFRDARLPFRIERGRLYTDSLRLAGPGGDWRASGSIAFDGNLDYVVSITLPPDVATRVSAAPALAAGALSDQEGRVLLDLRVTGPARAPRVQWNAQSMRQRAAGRVSSALTEQREKLKEDLLRQAGLARRESSAVTIDSLRRVSARSVEEAVTRRGRDLLKGLFGKPPPPPSAPESARTDTTHP